MEDNNKVSEEKKRSVFIDNAKGICMLSVVILHIMADFLPNFNTLYQMPLYYFISGIFFSKYDCFATFLKKKLNSLIIPYCFFFIPNLIFFIIFLFKSNFDIYTSYHRMLTIINAPIWFLISLFETIMLFYIIGIFKKEIIRIILIIFISIIGYRYRFDFLPFMTCTLNGLIFYSLGYYMRKYSPIMKDYKYIAIKTILIVIVFIAIINLQRPIPSMHIDNISSLPYWYFILSGTSGIISIIYISKWINNRCKWLQIIGCNSLIILGTHLVYVRIFGFIIPYEIMKLSYVKFILLLIITLLFIPTINFFTKYFPRFCAQKPFFKI